MRTILAFAILTLLAPAGRACPHPPPMTDKLVLLTSVTTEIPSDGGLLVQRTQIMHDAPGDDAKWTVRDKATGAAVTVAIEPLGALGGRLERWTFATAADRELEIVNRAGTVVAVVQQRAAKGGKLDAPKLERMTSTLANRHVTHPMAVPGATMVAKIIGNPPANARFLAVTIEGEGMSMPIYAFDATAAKLEWIVHGGKACSGRGSMPLAVGDHVSLAWIDEAGRRSPATRVVVARAR